jgi:hypothetical protein
VSCAPFGGYQPNQAQPEAIAVKNIRYVFISKEFSYQDRIAIDAAIDKWNVVLNDQISFIPIYITHNMSLSEIEEDTKGRNVIIFMIDSKSKLLRPGDRKTIAFTNKLGGSGIFIFRKRIKDNDLEDVVVHELAHCLFAKHLPGTLMAIDFDKKLYDKIDKTTAEQVAKYEHLDLSKMKYSN